MTAEYVVTPDGCWQWQGYCDANGYPFTTGKRRAHRMYWERVNGPIPEGHHIHHQCHNPSCVNPDHLEALDPLRHAEAHRLAPRGLTIEDIAEIRRRGKERVRAADLAEEYGVPHITIWAAWRGHHWSGIFTDGPIEPVAGICQRVDCDKPVIGHRHKKYCCSTCRGIQNDRDLLVKKRGERNCEDCGESIVHLHGGRRRCLECAPSKRELTYSPVKTDLAA